MRTLSEPDRFICDIDDLEVTDAPKEPTRVKTYKEWLEEDHPRDELGRFDSGGGGGGAAGMVPAADIYQTIASDQLSVITPNALSAVLAEAATHDPKLEPTNLMRLQLTGEGNQHLYSDHATEHPRSEMPQLPTDADGQQRYGSFMAAHGIMAQVDEADPRELRAAQTELNAPKIARIYQALVTNGGRLPGPDVNLIVSQDNVVVDGHHRWAAYAAYAVDHPNTRVPVLRLNSDIETIISLSNQFSRSEGIPSVGFAARGRATMASKQHKLGEKPTSPPPDPNRPYLWVDGKWRLVAVDSDSEDEVLLGETKSKSLKGYSPSQLADFLRDLK